MVPAHPVIGMQTKLPRHTVVLLGVGHTNAHVLRMWKMKAIPDAQLICVSNYGKATYSGMLPGVLADQYPVERMEIDLVRLCASAGARLIIDEVTGIDLEERRLLFKERPGIAFDALSIGVGSIPTRQGVAVTGAPPLAIKPMQTFLPRLKTRLDELCTQHGERTLKIAVVGAGAGGTEIVLCLPARLRTWFPDRTFEVKLVCAAERTVTGGSAQASKLVEQELRHRRVEVLMGRRVAAVGDGELTLDDGEKVDADLAIWATGATAPPLLSQLGLDVDHRGFLLTRPDLLVVSGHPIFAVGDSGTSVDHPTDKAGVFAVRQGPVLWRNLPRLLAGQSLEPYRPQSGFLTLLNFGDGRAVAQYKGRTFRGRWCWWLKDFIDSKFMDKYQDYRPMEMAPEAADADEPMRCAGCGGKVGGSVLSRVLARLDVPPSDHVLVGLDSPDDAAIIRIPDGRPVTATTDFFSAPLDDPYLVGRIAALNAASDVFAMGAKPIAALTLATIPVGRPRVQEQLLYETLAGSLYEFRRMGTTLAGGHTIEGPTLTVGYTVLADQGDAPPRTKGRVRIGDQLVLTKPLGSGVLLAGHMQAKCRAEWMSALLETMLLSNEHAAQLIEEADISGLTDVTGFGLAGHLLEMLKPAELSAELSLDAIPLLPGASELMAEGLESTLAPANRDVESALLQQESMRARAAFKVLFDPQTCGGLLMGVAPRNVDNVLARLREQSDVSATVIGEIVPRAETSSTIRLK